MPNTIRCHIIHTFYAPLRFTFHCIDYFGSIFHDQRPLEEGKNVTFAVLLKFKIDMTFEQENADKAEK